MNKLHVSLKLIRLLNERTRIDSALVASELNVSLRTAQRYLLELSALPCVIAGQDNHSYSLAKDYKLKDVLLNQYNCEQTLRDLKEVLEGATGITTGVCLTCAVGRKLLPENPSSREVEDETKRHEKMKDLLFLVNKMLSEKRCLLQ